MGSKTSIVDDAINVQVFLSTFANGVGFKEVQCMLGHLGIPNLVGMRGAYAHKLEDMCRSIQDATSGVVYSAFLEEIEAVIGEQLSNRKMRKTEIESEVDVWHNLEGPRSDKDLVGLTIAFDMGWNKRGCGHRYDSLSGHAVIIGTKTKK